MQPEIFQQGEFLYHTMTRFDGAIGHLEEMVVGEPNIQLPQN
jgi:hypothetical protein